MPKEVSRRGLFRNLGEVSALSVAALASSTKAAFVQTTPERGAPVDCSRIAKVTVQRDMTLGAFAGVLIGASWARMYSTRRDNMEEVWQSGLMGGITGVVIGTITGSLRGRALQKSCNR